MACPFFDPAGRFEAGPMAGRYPLGALHDGVCRAQPGLGIHPPDEVKQTFCNFGYARGQCAYFPGNDSPDAVRFGIASDRGGLVRIDCVLERDYDPHSYIGLDFDGHTRRLVQRTGEMPPACGELVMHQAEAYLQQYLRRQHRA